MPPHQRERVERPARLAGDLVEADDGEAEPEHRRQEALQHRAGHDGGDDGHAEQGRCGIFGGAEHQREPGEGRGDGHQRDPGDQSTDDRGDRRPAIGLCGLSLARHRIAVDGGDHGGGCAGNVDQDCRDGAAGHRAAIERDHHADGEVGLERKGQRDEQGDAHGRGEAGRRAEDEADGHADHDQRERQRIGDLVDERDREMGENIHWRRLLFGLSGAGP